MSQVQVKYSEGFTQGWDGANREGKIDVRAI